MRHLRLLLLLLISMLNPNGFSADASRPGFYVWQRAWTDEVKTAVRGSDRTLAVLVAEWPRGGQLDQPTQVAVAWDCFQDLSKVTAVLRIHTGYLQQPGLVEQWRQIIHLLPQKCQKVQIDLDCPERLLATYAQLLKTFRAQLPAQFQLSITALPCHLKHQAFRDLQASIDYFVLQVHGNEIPRKMDDPHFRLFDLKSAKSAVTKGLALAEATGGKCVVALPTYAYRLIFHASDGALKRVEAEVQKPLESDENFRILGVIPADLGHFLSWFDTQAPKSQLIWFRLPNPSDVMCWPLEVVEALEAGKILDETPRWIWEQGEGGLIKAYLVNFTDFERKRVKVDLAWPGEKGEWFVPQTVTLVNPGFRGILPKSLILRSPAVGQRVFVGWFRPENFNEAMEVKVSCLAE